ncbi:hypothetical protein VNO77_44849 [Canavalia gladiata]|uniref:Uncharacterized protein n=1 Tax=Canavalia gladiata TaxID=3824 RepID=A0AAN9PQT9_CANGL
MKRNCYLDLRFRPSGSTSPHDSMNEPLSINKRVVAIQHNRRHHTFDITELQARVIIWLASQERNGSTGASSAPSLSILQPRALLMHTPQGFSIKRSLRHFLQKRKKRSQSHISIATHNSKT